LKRDNKLWNVLAVLLGAALGASFEDDKTRLVFAGVAGAFIAEMAYGYLSIFLGTDQRGPTRTDQQPSAELRRLRIVVERWYRAIVVCGGLGGVALLADRLAPALFGIGLAAMCLSALTFVAVWFSVGRRMRMLEAREFGDHPDPNMRALLRGEIDLAEYAKRQTPPGRQ
jgi:hypothetical protein